MRLALALLLFTVGCDARATASDPQPAAHADQKSKEYESCGATLHCADELRCFQNTCVRPVRSTVGDYYVALGRRTYADANVKASIAAYAQAIAQYETEKIAVPADIDCAYGAALAADRGSKESGELAARVLHRCLLQLPPSAPLRREVFDGLAILGDAGLDPALLGQAKLADLYLTKGPTKPATDKLAVTITAAPAPVKSMPLIDAKLGEADIKSSLVACWDQYHATAKKDAFTVVIALRGAYVTNEEYPDEGGRFVTKIEPAVGLPAGTPDAAVDACVRAVVEPAIKGLKIAENFATKLSVSVK